MTSVIRVGIGVVVLNPQGKILAGKRKSEHGKGSWGLTGGHLDFGESFESCARRETLEETGLELQNPELLCAANHVFDQTKHYVTIYMIGHVSEALPQNLEQDKFETWQYFDSLETLPQPHFVPYLNDVDRRLIDAYRMRHLRNF